MNTDEHGFEPGCAALRTSELLNYLKAAGGGVGMLLNFGRQPTFKRLVLGRPRRESPSAAFPSGITYVRSGGWFVRESVAVRVNPCRGLAIRSA